MRDGKRPALQDALLWLEGLWCGYMLYWTASSAAGIPGSVPYKLLTEAGCPRWLAFYLGLSMLFIGFQLWTGLGMVIGRLALWAWAYVHGKRIEACRRSLKGHPVWTACAVQAFGCIIAAVSAAALCSGAAFGMIEDGGGALSVAAGFLGVLSVLAGMTMAGIIACLEAACLVLCRFSILWFYDMRDGQLADKKTDITY